MLPLVIKINVTSVSNCFKHNYLPLNKCHLVSVLVGKLATSIPKVKYFVAELVYLEFYSKNKLHNCFTKENKFKLKSRLKKNSSRNGYVSKNFLLYFKACYLFATWKMSSKYPIILI